MQEKDSVLTGDGDEEEQEAQMKDLLRRHLWRKDSLERCEEKEEILENLKKIMNKAESGAKK